MNIIQFNSAMCNAFEEMLVEYFMHDLQSDIPEAILRDKLLNHILGYAEKQVTHIAIPMEHGVSVGFSIYQIDTPESDWCKRPGWGCIREFCILKDHRSKGFGAALAAYTEQQLRNLGAAQIYLTSDNAIAFWERCGYCNTHEICTNDLEILTK